MKSLFKLLSVSLFVTTILFGEKEYNQHIHTVIVPADWKPYFYLLEDGKPTGYAVELFELVAKEAGIKYRYKIVPTWIELWPYFESGEAHIVPSLGISDSRRGFSDFSSTTDTFSIHLFKRSNSNHIKNIKSLKDKKVAVVYRNIGQSVMEKYKDIQTVVYKNHFEAITALLSGEVDGFCYPKPLMDVTLKSLNIDDKIVSFTKPLFEIKRAIGISNKHKPLIEPINKALEKIKANGEYERVYHKWFDKEKPIELTKKDMVIVGLVLFFILILIIVLFYYITTKKKWLITQNELQNQIDIKTKEVKKREEYITLLFNSNPNIQFTTNGKYLISANRAFLDFTRFESVEKFKEKYECICDIFEQKDGYITKNIDGMNWIDYILKNDDILHKACIIVDKQEIIFLIQIETLQMIQKDKYIIVLSDITEIENTKENLERSNEDLQQFAYIASHDLQEPLRMVSSYMQLIERRYKDKLDQDGLEFINFAVDGAKRMQELINGLLQFSRVQTQGEEFHEVDMDHLLKDTISNLSISIKEKDALIKINEPLPNIFADKRQILQLFQNLISNSLKYCENKPIIEISFFHQNSEVVFTIKDNGIGIAKEYYDKIFLIFQRLHTKTEAKYEGNGIGLAVCKRIVQRHGGRIWLDSEEGKGTTFYLSFPSIKI